MAEQATKPAAAPRIPTDSEAQPGHEQIVALAYSLWEAKGRVDGSSRRRLVPSGSRIEGHPGFVGFGLGSRYGSVGRRKPTRGSVAI